MGYEDEMMEEEIRDVPGLYLEVEHLYYLVEQQDKVIKDLSVKVFQLESLLKKDRM